MLHSGIFHSCYISSLCSGNREGWYTGGSGGGGGQGTIVSCDVSDLCADQRSQVRGYEDRLPHGSSFRLLLRSYHTGFVGTVSTLFCFVNNKLILLFEHQHRVLLRDCNLGCFCRLCCYCSFTMQHYRFDPKSKWWTVVQLKEPADAECVFVVSLTSITTT